MRPIEFRAKAKDPKNCNCLEDNGFVFGGIAFDGCTNDTYITRWNSFGLGFIENIEIDPATVGQFTGLTDNNGKRIYEGDIVATKYGRLCIVEWFDSQNQHGWDLYPIHTVDNLKHRVPDKYDLWLPKNLEIIGIIHDNLELL